MYTVYHGSWRDFGTAVGMLFAPKRIRYLMQRLLGTGLRTCYRQTVRGKMLAGKCLRGSVLFASLTRHTLRLWALTRPSAQPTVPCQGKVECFVFATNGTIERFGNLVRQELMNVWRDSILFASLTRHTIVANATIKTVPCHGKSGCLRLRSN